MFFACGLSNYYVSLFHLFNHAFFKALLFLSAGSIIHSMRDEQDMRRLGGLSQTMPVTYICVLIGSLALSGFPFLSGFYSKDVILETSLGAYTLTGYFAFWLGSLTAFLTAFYSFRLFYIGFMQETSSPRTIVTASHESGLAVLIPLTILGFGSILSGYFFRDFFIGLGSDGFSGSIFVRPESLFLLNAEFIPFIYKSIPLIFSLGGIFLSILFYHRYGYSFSLFWLGFHPVTHFFGKKWYFDTLYNRVFTTPSLKAGYAIFFKALDKGVIEYIGPTGLSNLTYLASKKIKKAQTGYIHTYVTSMVFALILIFIAT